MYASISPLKAERDPRPFVDTETGKRYNSDALGTPGMTLQFAPREEYMTHPINPVNKVLDEFRDYYTDVDQWGSSMAWLGIVVTALKKIFNEHAPANWRGEVRRAELDVIADIINELSPEELHAQLIFAGEVMNRLATAAWLRDEDYPLSRSAGSSSEEVDEETIVA